MKRSLLSKLAGAAVLLLSAWPAAAETIAARTVNDDLSWIQDYWSRPHNTYEKSNYPYLLKALEEGHRVIELDVYDQGNLVVKHNPHDSNTSNNCRGGNGGTLRECLKDIKIWNDFNPQVRPIVVQLDLKTDDLVGGWGGSRLAELNAAVFEELNGNGKLYTPEQLRLWTGYGSIREGVYRNGWPNIHILRGKILVTMMGGPLGRKNQMMQSYVRTYGGWAGMFVCPEVSEPKHFYWNGNAKDFTNSWANGWVVCGNQQAVKYWYKNTSTAKANSQLVNLWHSDHNYFEAFHNMYLAAGWGASFISRQSRHNFNGKVHNDGERRTAWVGFQLRNDQSGMCAQMDSYGNGTAIIQRPCNNSLVSQQWHYSDETQLRPVGGNAFCLDINGGNGNNNDRLHLWNCDGGASEKWHLREDGRFVGMNGRCMDAVDNNNGTQWQLRNCSGGASQRFTNVPSDNAIYTRF